MKKALLLAFVLIANFSIAQTVSFTTNTSDYCINNAVTFTNTTTPAAGAGSTYSWNFGDGNLSSQENPTHTYLVAGNYNVQLVVTDSFGVTYGTTTQFVSVNGPGDLLIQSDSTCPNSKVLFQFMSSAPNFTIDFGDGTVTNTPLDQIQHDYLNVGTYQVTLTENYPCGNFTTTDSIVVSNSVQVQGAYLNVNNQTCPGDNVQFSLGAMGVYDYHIDFGDGTSSVDYKSHLYNNPGIYTSIVTIYNECGNSIQFTEIIEVLNNLPIQGFLNLAVPTNLCPNDELEFTTNNSYQNYFWDFGNGDTYSGSHQASSTYNNPGTYNVSVTFENGCGNDTTLFAQAFVSSIVQITGNNTSYFLDSVCLGEPLGYDSNLGTASEVLWDFGNGDVSNDEYGSYVFTTPGNQIITSVFTNGCYNTDTSIDTIYVGNNIAPNPNLYQALAFPNVNCVLDSVTFLVLSNSNNSTFTWDFGDGNSAGILGQVVDDFDGRIYEYSGHMYDTSGIYFANLNITNACGLTVQKEIPVLVADGVAPQGVIISNNTSYNCLGNEMEFLGIGGSYQEWNFGDGSPIISTNNNYSPVTHIFGQAGTYQVELKIINECGLSTYAYKTIVIENSLVQVSSSSQDANCGLSNGAAGLSISGGNAPFIVEWSNGDEGYIADSLSAGIYEVVIKDSKGCVQTAYATVSNVEAPAVVVNSLLNVACSGESSGAIDINVIGNTGPYNYNWSNGGLTEDIYNVSAGQYEVTVTDANGCQAIESITVMEETPAFVSFVSNKPTCGNTDGAITANVNGGVSPYSYVWSNGLNTQTISGVGAGVYDLTVIDGNGCFIQESIALSEQLAPSIIVDSLTALDCGGQASVFIKPIGGTAPYSFVWSNNTINEDLINVSGGTYSVTVTDANNCSANQYFDIEETTPEGLQICLVSVSPIGNHNTVVWDKTSLTGIESFNIYKESSVIGAYFLAGNVHYDSLSQFTDLGSDPAIRAWRYKIASVDNCGNESILSLHHKTIHLTSNVGLNGDINLIWSHYEGGLSQLMTFGGIQILMARICYHQYQII